MPGGRDKPGSSGTGGAERRRYTLPSNLSGSLGQLDDGQFDRLLPAVLEEARRRGRRIVGEHTPSRASGSATVPGPAPAGGGRAKKRRPLPLAPGQARFDPGGIRGRRQAGGHRPAAARIAHPGVAGPERIRAWKGLILRLECPGGASRV